MAISRFLQRLAPSQPYDDLPVLADPVAVVGDVHGRADLLELVLRRLERRSEAARTRLIFVGDLIDRGPDSARVLARVRELTDAPGPFGEVHCLMGNHERMMLDFLSDPLRHGPRWLGNGGDATLESYGLSAHRSRTTGPNRAQNALRDLAAALAGAMPPETRAWLAQRPLIWQEDRLVVSHAGADPTLPIDRQSERDLIWGHSAFRSRMRRDGIWIAHGHVIVPVPSAREGRISVDTGAWRSGKLTAAWISGGTVKFSQC